MIINVVTSGVEREEQVGAYISVNRP